jgi:drug/metabolite transporter (DMT)-like permease
VSAPTHRNPALGVGLVVLGATLFIVNAGVSRVALRAGVDPVTLTTIRVTGSTLVLVLFAALFRPAALRPPGGRLAWLLVAHGLIGVAALQWTYFVAIDRLPVGMALLLEYQAPILVAVWARLVQKEDVRGRMWVGLALAMVGLAAATGIWRGLAFDVVGIVAGLGAAVCFATYFLIGEHGVGLLDPLRVILWSFLVATVALNLVSPLTAFDTGLLDDQVSLLGRLADVYVPVWSLLLWVVLLGTLVPFAVELAALGHLRATTVTMIAMIEPVGVSALGWLWFYESLDAVALVGGVAVVAGIVLAQSARRAPVLVEPPHL